MKQQSMPVPPSSYRRGRNFGIIICLFAFATRLAAQDLPPIPGGGGDTKPREPTPEELEAQRKGQKELWRKNREVIAPYLPISVRSP